MEVLKKFGQAVDNAFGALVDKHRKTADLNRIRMVVRCEERAAEKEYLALGRYYYNTLRDKANPVAESHCAQLDEIERRLEQALGVMQEFYEKDGPVAVYFGEDGPETLPENCIGVIGAPGHDKEDEEAEYEEIDLSDVESYDQDPSLAAAVKPQELRDENEELPFEG